MLDFMCGGAIFARNWLLDGAAGLTIQAHLLLAQQGDGGAPGGGAPGGRGFLGETSFIWVMLAIGVLFYFLMMRPEQKQKARVLEMQQGLRINDRVVTVGGIYGTVVNSSKGSTDVTIRIDDSTKSKMRVERGSIKRVITDDPKTTDEGKD